jgi:FAD/FMN-containing dehydrogenase
MMTGNGELRGWGRHAVPGVERAGENLDRLTIDVPISRGLGRSYGDSSLPPPTDPRAANTTRADRVLSFDAATGRLRAEAGLSLLEMNRLFLSRGFFTPVSPGTQYVTLGGMVAADVHGKNQHASGDFGDHVRALRMRVADGRVVECSPDTNPDLFFATIGGMGLTGHVLEVEVVLEKIPSMWILQEVHRIENIDVFQDALEEAAPKWPYTVGWLDCLSTGKNLGRGLLMIGRWAEPDEAPSRPPRKLPRPIVPFDFPDWALSRPSLRVFNEAFFRKQLVPVSRGITRYDSFFYPLDAIREWNRLYGKRGFTQYQCVIPREAGRGGARRIMQVLVDHGGASFLSVIKDFGRGGQGTLSFPRAGITLNLDLPVREDTQAVVDALNEQLLNEGGRIYLAKDSFTRPEHFRAMEGDRLARFTKVRDAWDPTRRFRSAQSVRLMGDPK